MKLTESEKTFLKTYLKIELNNGGNKYTDILLKLEKELENEESDAKEYFNRKATKQVKMVKRGLKEFGQSRENLIGTMETLKFMNGNEKLIEYMKGVIENFDMLFIGSKNQQSEAKLFFETIEK